MTISECKYASVSFVKTLLRRGTARPAEAVDLGDALAEHREAPGLASELMALPREGRRRALAEEPRFARLGLVAHLLSRESADDPAASEERTRLALEVLARLPTGRYPAELIFDFVGRAWALLGEARLRQGDLAGGEVALRRARLALWLGTGDPLEKALLLEREACLRRRQGRELEARLLLRRARDLHLEVGNRQAAAALEGVGRTPRIPGLRQCGEARG